MVQQDKPFWKEFIRREPYRIGLDILSVLILMWMAFYLKDHVETLETHPCDLCEDNGFACYGKMSGLTLEQTREIYRQGNNPSNISDYLLNRENPMIEITGP